PIAVGIALFPGHGSDAGTLLRRARVAMFEAIRTGRSVALFVSSLDEARARRLSMLGDLRRAIEHDGLTLYCQPKLLLDANGIDQPLSINLSAIDLHDPTLLDRLRGLFATWGASPEWVQFELTESALMEDPHVAIETLTRLRALGVKLFVDDFGIGYSSLAYLQKLPVHAIKIDQSFVTAMTDKNASAAIVRSTVELGHDLGLQVVAEGVE